MRVALVSPPFSACSPKKYGGTELFIAQLAEGLKKPALMSWCMPTVNPRLGSRRAGFIRIRSGRFPRGLRQSKRFQSLLLGDRDAAADCDIIHLHNVPALMFCAM